jgi:predicted metal-dependent peptidase
MADINDPIYQLIVAARVQLLFDKPFFGNVAARLILVDATDWCGTAATDGRHLYYNREFIKSLQKDELMFLVAHEILHCIYDHLGRRGGRDPKLLNMAQDYVINYTLIEDRCGKMPDMGLYDKRFPDTMLSEEVYEILKKESVTIRMPLDEHLDLLGEDPKDDKDDGGGSGDQNGKGQKYVDVTVMGKNGPPKLTEEDIAKIRSEIKASVIQAAQAAGAGNVPRGVARMIEDLINPKLDWRTLLDAHIRSSVKDDYTLQRMSRKTSALRYAASEEQNARAMGTADDEHFEGEMSVMSGLEDDDDASFSVPMLPTQDYMNTVDIMVAIDTSGSMTETMLRDFLSETKGIMQTFRDFRVRVCTFDTQLYNYMEFTGENIDSIDDYPMAGGGGTMFEAVWEYMKREGIEPHRLVLFTDGYPNSTWGDEGYVDTLFVIHGNNQIKAPWGITCYYEANEG